MSENGDLLSQWRGYADDGAGISIGFNSEYFEELGKHKQAREDKFNASLQKIEYDLAKQTALIAERSEKLIKLASEGVLDSPTFLGEVLYPEKRKETETKFRELINRFVLFMFDLYILKNPAFSEEKEWRIISHLLGKSADSDFGSLRNMNFRAKKDRVIPYFRMPLEELSHKSIVEVILGPKNVTPDKFIEAFLAKNGWQGVSVRRSSASYR